MMTTANTCFPISSTSPNWCWSQQEKEREAERNRQIIKDALTAAEQASRAKSDFLSRMSHEIRTPMNAVIGMTTIAAASLDNRDKLTDCLGKIGLSSRYLLSLINDILDMCAH